MRLGGDQGDAGDDAMGAAGEQAQHAGGVGGVFGLAEDLIVEGDGGVGAEDDLQWVGCFGREFREDGLGFLAGQAGYVGDGVFVGVGIFRDVGGMDLKCEAGLGEEFAATGRGGGQDQHRLIMPWMGGGRH